jgi:hypothetical protein
MGFGAHLHRLYPHILYLNVYLIPLLVHAFASRFSEDIDEVDNTPLGARLAEPSTVRSKLRRPSTVDDLAGVPLLISAPGSHCERSTRAEATRRWHRLIAYARGHKILKNNPMQSRTIGVVGGAFSADKFRYFAWGCFSKNYWGPNPIH